MAAAAPMAKGISEIPNPFKFWVLNCRQRDSLALLAS